MKASWVAIDLMEFAVRTEEAVQSPETALEWLRSFRDTLLMEGRNSRPMPWAVELLGMADIKIAKKSIARMQGQIVKIYGKDCDVDLECSNKYGEKYEKLKNILAAATHREAEDVSANGCKTLTADGDTREDSQAKPDGSAITRNETRAHDALDTSANHYGDAPHREAGDESATVSRNMRRVPQNEAPAHGFSGGRTAQGTMSRSPEAAAQSGKDYDQEPYQVSTGEARQSQHGAGEVTPESVSAPSPALPILSFGEFGNIKMTNMQYAKLCERFGNADSVLAEADQYFEAQPAKKKKYKNHYAMLLNWCKRRETESKPKQGYMTSDDISKKNYEKAMREIEAMCAGEAV